MAGELNNDWVLWASILAVAFSAVFVVVWAWKATRGMEGLEDDEFAEQDKRNQL